VLPQQSTVFPSDWSRKRPAMAVREVVQKAGLEPLFRSQVRTRVEGLDILERIEGGRHQASTCAGPPAVLGWATGSLHEPPNNPQVGMANMRTLMPALQKARTASVPIAGAFAGVAMPSQRRDTRVVTDLSPDAVAQEIVEWIRQ
jgi:electron transfer flavoprotein beta subunit